MRSEAWRWSRDEDGWLHRPTLQRDKSLPSEGDYIADGCDSFFEHGQLYCRNAKQRRRLDLGLSPAPTDKALLDYPRSQIVAERQSLASIPTSDDKS